MSSKIELTIARDYVPGWTIVDAIRELFQNALDQEVQFDDNTASWSYDGDTEVLRICNKKSVLPVRSLLLGTTTKADDNATIGQFGEGYKVAMLVLLRSGKNVVIYNYGAKEVWRPRFVKSRRFGTEILTVFIDKFTWTKPPTADLTIEVQGITPQEYHEELVPANLHLQRSVEVEHTTEYGDVLGADFRGRVYVNGLYVCAYEPYSYGYNFKPGQLRLDRDRKLVSDFDLRWLASKMWSKLPDALDLVENGCADVAYIAENYWLYKTDLAAEAWDRFQLVNGPHAIPVASQDELKNIPAGYHGVIVPASYNSLIRRAPDFEDPIDPVPTALERLRTWYEEHVDDIEYFAAKELEEIIDELEAQ
jgi:hypothetical protein